MLRPARLLWRRLVHGERRLEERPHWRAFAGQDWADGIMNVAVTDRFHAKQGRSTGRWILRHRSDRLAVYLKRHYEIVWWRRLLATLWPSRSWSPAFEESNHLHWAREHGIPVPATMAVGELVGPWFRLQSFLAIEELADMLPLHEAVPLAAQRLEGPDFACWKNRLVAELARLTRRLHEANRFHKDLYLCHFFVRAEDVETAPASFEQRVSLIDLHRLGRHRLTRRHWQVKDLAQLLYSTDLEEIGDRDRLRFFRAYLGNDRLSARRLLRAVIWKAEFYRRHNEGQRAPRMEKRMPAPLGRQRVTS